MTKITKAVVRLIGAGALAAMLAVPAIASDDEDGDDDGHREIGFSFNIGLNSNYVFRGIAQSAKDPVLQGGADVTFGMLYAGVWASGLDFGRRPAGTGTVANAEVDFYAGITPSLGPVNFDLGGIFYAYPGAFDPGADLDFWEVKAGASTTLINILGLSATAYYTNEGTGKTGEIWTLEGGASVDLPKLAFISPSVSVLFATVQGSNDPQFLAAINGSSSYNYWNAGVTLGIDKLSIDLRYWDSDISDAGGFCSGSTFQCDEQYSATVKFTF